MHSTNHRYLWELNLEITVRSGISRIIRQYSPGAKRRRRTPARCAVAKWKKENWRIPAHVKPTAVSASSSSRLEKHCTPTPVPALGIIRVCCHTNGVVACSWFLRIVVRGGHLLSNSAIIFRNGAIREGLLQCLNLCLSQVGKPVDWCCSCPLRGSECKIFLIWTFDW